MRIALATCAVLPRPDTDLPILVEAFRAQGADASVERWDDAALAWDGFDAVVVRSTWDYVGRLDEFLSWVDRVDRATRLFNPAQLMRWNLHKRYLVEFAAAGVPVVSTRLLPAGREADWSALFEEFGDLVVKPAVSAGSFATIRVQRGDSAAARAHRAAHIGRDLLVQPLLESVVRHGESNLVHFGGAFSHAIHKGARWDGDGEQSRGLIEPDADEHALARAVLARVASDGRGSPAYARVDMARDLEGRPVLMELELVEPALFLDRAPERAARFVSAVLDGVR